MKFVEQKWYGPPGQFKFATVIGLYVLDLKESKERRGPNISSDIKATVSARATSGTRGRSSRTRKTHDVHEKLLKVDIGDGARTRDTVVVLGVPAVIFSLGRVVSRSYTPTFSKVVLFIVTTL